MENVMSEGFDRWIPGGVFVDTEREIEELSDALREQEGQFFGLDRLVGVQARERKPFWTRLWSAIQAAHWAFREGML